MKNNKTMIMQLVRKGESKIIFLLLTFLILACASKPSIVDTIPRDLSCKAQQQKLSNQNIEVQLNSLLFLFERGCYQEVIELGTLVRQIYRDKYYSILKEVVETVVYEGVAKDYVMDSHERIFLSILIATSYLKLQKNQDAEIELNKAYDESIAAIYNTGTDEVNVFLQGLLWLRLSGIEKARPFFEKIISGGEAQTHLVIYCQNLLKHYTQQKTPLNLRVQTLNQLPSFEFTWLQNYKKTYSQEPHLQNCLSDSGIVLTTKAWIKDFEKRDHPEQDKLLAWKRTLRLPVVLTYSTLVFVAGAGLTYLSAQGGGAGDLTASLAILTLFATERTFVNGMAPDMRNWYDLPEAIYVANATLPIESEPCLRRYRNLNLQHRDLFAWK